VRAKKGSRKAHGAYAAAFVPIARKKRIGLKNCGERLSALPQQELRRTLLLPTPFLSLFFPLFFPPGRVGAAVSRRPSHRSVHARISAYGSSTDGLAMQPFNLHRGRPYTPEAIQQGYGDRLMEPRCAPPVAPRWVRPPAAPFPPPGPSRRVPRLPRYYGAVRLPGSLAPHSVAFAWRYQALCLSFAPVGPGHATAGLGFVSRSPLPE